MSLLLLFRAGGGEGTPAEAPPSAISSIIVAELPAGAVASSHKIARLIEVLVDGEVAQEITEAIDGAVTLDANAASRGRLDLSVAGTEELIPTNPQSLLAPYGNELRVSRGIEFPDRIELVALGIFRIDRSTASEGADGVLVRVAGLDRSARFIDAAFEEPGQIVSGTNATDAILQVLEAIWPDVPTDFFAVTAPLPLLAYEEGEDRWAFAQGIATSIGGELYFDGTGTLVLRPVPSAGQGNPVAELSEGEGGVLLGVERDWDRSPVHNRVIVTGENTSLDESAPIPRAVATDASALSPTYYFGRFGRKPRFWASSFISSNTQAADAAAGILARSIGAPDVVSFGAVVDPAREPSDVVRITRERLGLQEDHVIDSLVLPLGVEGEMTGTTRATQVLA